MFTKENRYLFLIIMIFIAACIETDIFLPAMVDMMSYFSVSEEKIQSLLTLNFVGICIGCPLYGPLADAFGRKKPLIAALTLFLIGSIFTLIAKDFSIMLIGRILQGLGSGGCFTLGTAILFDLFPKEKAMTALNKINSIIPFIMALAPVLGGALNNSFGFQSNFIVIALIVLLSLSICLFFFKETLPKDLHTPFIVKKVTGDFKTVLSCLSFWQTTLTLCLLFSGYIAFLSTISVLYVKEFGISILHLPYYQVALLGSWLLANFVFTKAIKIFNIEKVKKISASLFATGGIGFCLVTAFLPKDPYLQTVFMSIYAFGANWICGIYFPESMSLFPENKGTSASLITCGRLLISAITVFAVSHFYNGTIYPIAIAIFLITISVSALLVSYENAKGAKTLKQPN